MKQQREEFDGILHILEKIIVLLPNLLARGWNLNSLTHIMKKLLHPRNNYKFLRKEGIR